VTSLSERYTQGTRGAITRGSAASEQLSGGGRNADPDRVADLGVWEQCSHEVEAPRPTFEVDRTILGRADVFGSKLDLTVLRRELERHVVTVPRLHSAGEELRGGKAEVIPCGFRYVPPLRHRADEDPNDQRERRVSGHPES